MRENLGLRRSRFLYGTAGQEAGDYWRFGFLAVQLVAGGGAQGIPSSIFLGAVFPAANWPLWPPVNPSCLASRKTIVAGAGVSYSTNSPSTPAENASQPNPAHAPTVLLVGSKVTPKTGESKNAASIGSAWP